MTTSVVAWCVSRLFVAVFLHHRLAKLLAAARSGDGIDSNQLLAQLKTLNTNLTASSDAQNAEREANAAFLENLTQALRQGSARLLRVH